MSLTENELIYLMAYVDHQVDDDELPEVIDLLERSEEARLIVAQHEALGDWVRTSSDLRAAEAGADRIATHVLAEIESLGGSKVIEIERQRAKVALQRQRVKEFTTLFAFAAVIFAFWAMPTRKDVVATNAVPGNAPTSVVKSKAPADVPSAAPSATEAVANGGGANGAGTTVGSDAAPPGALAANTEPEDTDVDVQSVDSDSPFSIFYVPAALGTEAEAHSSSVVVWIGEGE